ncbi:MAG: oligosaccharide flippase family protein, partial [bacterium]
LGGLSLALVKKFVGKIKLVGDRKMYQYILVSALPLGIAAITNPIIGKADTLLLSVLKDESAVGFYSLAYKIFEVFLVVPVFFVNAAYPYMVKHFKEGGARLLATSKKLGVVLFAGGLIALGLVWLLAPFMIRVLGGEGFEASILPLRILALSFPVFFVTNILLWHLITLGKRRAIPVIYWLAVIINIGANLVVIPHYSFVGSAVVNGLTEVFVLVGLFAVVLSKHE